MRCFLDIETIPAPKNDRLFLKPDYSSVKLGNLKDPLKIEAKIKEELESWEKGEGCALDSLQANIPLIGIAFDEENSFQSLYFPTEKITDEAELLCALWGLIMEKDTHQIIGHNIRFDANMIIHRSIIHDIAFPIKYMNDLFNYRPKIWIDTMDIWSLGDRRASGRKLDHICKALGISVKESPVCGADFFVWWETNKEACIEYNKQDVLAVKELCERLPGL
jgi:DNA polymerase elongation subunit (family B)